MEFAIMDDKGVIEDFQTSNEAMDSIDRVRKQNDDIIGDLKVIQILYTDN